MGQQHWEGFAELWSEGWPSFTYFSEVFSTIFLCIFEFLANFWEKDRFWLCISQSTSILRSL